MLENALREYLVTACFNLMKQTVKIKRFSKNEIWKRDLRKGKRTFEYLHVLQYKIQGAL